MPNPTISVVLCNYNYGHYLEQCLAGILRQTFQDFEVVITDDGSTDNSREIIEKATNLDRRMRPVFSKKNRGVMATLEDVMQRATGSLIFSEATDDFIVEASFFDRAVKGMHAYPQAAGFFGTAGLLSVQTSKLIGMRPKRTAEMERRVRRRGTKPKRVRRSCVLDQSRPRSG